MNRVDLLEPLLEGGIANTNFFNGRLLSAEDLRAEQKAGRQQRSQLGRAVGAGVVDGLWVERAAAGGELAAVMKVSAGLALNALGQPLALPSDTEVALVRAPEAGGAADAGLFSPCLPPSQTAVVAGAGVYVLAISPASGYTGRASTSGLGDAGLSSPGCGSRYAIEGVQFKLAALDVNKLGLPPDAVVEVAGLMEATDAASSSKLRNILAHLCYGDEELRRRARDIFDPSTTDSPEYGALDALRRQGVLTDCDVPLALLYWTTGGIQFVDAWAARRSPAVPSSAGRFAPFVAERRVREAEAMFLQFQQQLRETHGSEPSLDQMVASERFAYLPPVGFLPLDGPGGTPGFAYRNFFAGLSFRPPHYIEGAVAEPLMRLALNYGPVSVARREPLWLYQVLDGTTPRPYLIFVTAYVPFQAETRFDFVRWNFSRFAA
ncbi:MAG TPA: hypothetical protein VM936_11100 [Pyrinomonadaceae bacterium]|jgi:hypothetical protein|nr:hypothetical protein [Pyrinomonadaceae bacterium]